MEPSSITQYITSAFANVDIVVANEDSYIFYEPGGDIPKDHRFPFATIVIDDKHDAFSNLSRVGVFRLNVGVSKETFVSLFGSTAAEMEANSALDKQFDFTAIDQIMPHPVYGKMYWTCVLNPSEATFEKLKPMLAEAYEMAVKRHPGTRPTGK